VFSVSLAQETRCTNFRSAFALLMKEADRRGITHAGYGRVYIKFRCHCPSAWLEQLATHRMRPSRRQGAFSMSTTTVEERERSDGTE
jgi:hypothetical protein